ncbi:MAG TPA: signal peptidase I [Thermoplasmata archaeon]|jgi:signal peptidase I|nr:signal peptidase I [Thermoplasmata archaeon]
MPTEHDRTAPLLRRWRSLRVVVADDSMRPTLQPGDRLLVERWRSGATTLRAGDVAVLADPERSDRWLIKRVAAVGPARVFVVRSGVATRPGLGPVERPTDAIDGAEVPPGSAYVVSDGGPRGRDSRSFGPVPAERLVGVAWWRYAPRDRKGPIPPAPPG